MVSPRRIRLPAGGKLLPVLLPVIMTAVVYAPVCGFGFLNYDDNLHVYANPLVRGFDWDAFLLLWQRPYQGLYVPLTYTLWGLLAKLSHATAGGGEARLDPALFHALNLLVHLASVAVVFDILRRLLRNDLGAGAGALLFGLHPVQVEAVAWVTGLKDLLGGFCALLAMRQYILYLLNRERDGKGRASDYVLAAFFFMAALLSKPSAVVVPPMLAAIGFVLLRQPWSKLLLELGPWLVLALAVGLVTGRSQDISLIGVLPTFWQRFLVVGDTYVFYLCQLLLPLTNGIDYGRTPEAVLAGKWVYLVGLLPYPLAMGIFWRVREPIPRLVAALFLLALLPVSGLFSFYFQRLSTVADRYLYLGMFGPALGVAWLLTAGKSRLLRGTVSLALILCAVLCFLQVMTWSDFEKFYRHNLQVNPRSWFAHNNFGAAYADVGEWEKAEEQYRLAIQIKPLYVQPYYNLGMIRMRQLRYPEAADFFRKAIAVADRYYMAHYQLGNAMVASGKGEEAITSYRRVIEIYPQFSDVYGRLAKIYEQSGRSDLAVFYNAQGRSLGAGTQESGQPGDGKSDGVAAVPEGKW